jgi:hypothetical protein
MGRMMTSAAACVAFGLWGATGGAATVVTFTGGSPPGTYDAVTPGGIYGPELVLPDATFDGGVRLTNFQPREDRLDEEVYATSDFSPLADGSLLPGRITATFTTPVRAVRLSIQDWYRAAYFSLEAYASDDTLLVAETVLLDDFTLDPGDAGRLTTISDGITRIVVSSLQLPGEIDFAIDNVTFESGPIFTEDTPENRVEIGDLPATFARSSRFVTTQGDEPVCQCGTAQDGAPVWFGLIPTRSGWYVFDTSGSSYDTVVSVWIVDETSLSATPTVEVACDDDNGAGYASRVEFQASEGADYAILVTEYARDLGGDLRVEVVPEPGAWTCSLAALISLGAVARMRRR